MLGMIGTDSGPLGDAFAPFVEGARAWVEDVNGRGGVQGHPVRLIRADDGADPGKALALARRMVDQDRVIGFYGEHGVASFHAVMPFLEERSIPNFGTLGGTSASAKSPMTFDIIPGGHTGIHWAHLGQLLALSDKRKVSILFCRESSNCGFIRDDVRKWEKQVGIEIVHEAQVTISQPDYTGEVLAARGAGADAIILGVDNASATRVMRSAHRQNYYPQMVGNYAAYEQRFLDRAPPEDVEGVILAGAAPNYDAPKMVDFRAALSRYVPGAKLSNISLMAYLGGKLFEVASRNLPDRPTSADIVNGFYSLKGETLGGLFPPVTFLPGQPQDGVNLCVFPLKVEKRKFIFPKGDSYYICAPGWAPRQ